MSLDPTLAAVIVTAIFATVATVAITYRQKDVAALAIKALGRLQDEKPSPEQIKKPQEQSGSES